MPEVHHRWDVHHGGCGVGLTALLPAAGRWHINGLNGLARRLPQSLLSEVAASVVSGGMEGVARFGSVRGI
jgi:hypothetical protein